MRLLDAGISRDLAIDRASRIADVRCALRVSIPSDTTSPIAGRARLDFTLHDASSALILDFAPDEGGQLQACHVNGRSIVPRARNGHLVVPASALHTGHNAVVVAFQAGDAPLNRRDGYLYTLFVPARAHEAFPCFDQPDIRVRWSLTLELPEDWRGVSNTCIAASPASEHDAGGVDALHRAVVSFAETEPLPTYLFAFAAGRFEEERLVRSGRAIAVYHRAHDRELLAANLDAIATAHAAALDWLEDYTSIPYPFGTFGIVLLPDFQFGGMEHPGAIFYNQSSLLLPSSATRNQQLARASVIAHETAHMWFGDLVTMSWFDDVWMKEVCATFLAAKIVNPEFPDLDHDLRFLHAHYPGAYDVDRTAGAHAIRQPLGNLAEAASLYGAIVYLKSPIVLRQLEMLLGEPKLRDALRDYLSAFAFGSASWPDLLAILSRYSPIDLVRWSNDWIGQAGRPRIEIGVDRSNAGDGVSIVVRTTDPLGSRGLLWSQAVDIAMGSGATIAHVRVWLDGTAKRLECRGPGRPDFILPNGRGLAYGECHLDEGSRNWLLRNLPDTADALTRGSAWLALWDAMLTRAVTPGALFDLALRSLAQETNELNLQRILADLHRLFWVFHARDERQAYAAQMEASLRDLLERVPTSTMKAAAFATFRAVATTAPAVAWLHTLWTGDTVIPGLPLAEPDRIELVKELAIRSPASISRTWLEQQRQRTQDAEQRAALTFLADALSDDEEERGRFFACISRPENRRREPWVIEGAKWLHHPLRAERAVALITPGLALIDELRRTGDIFLPKRWADAMLGGHGSVAAAEAVRRFLDGLSPDYPPALRRVVLASADYLFRAAAAPLTPP